MSSRESILKAVRANKPAVFPALPEFVAATGQDPVTRFTSVIKSSGARVVVCDEHSIADEISDLFPEGRIVSSGISLPQASTVDSIESDRAFTEVELFLCRGVIGVGENGAIWVTENECRRRAALFLPQHVGLVVTRNSIVETMTEAYRKIVVDESGWGVFVAGPSKTADIEQSLVIGAHGPRSLTVFIV